MADAFVRLLVCNTEGTVEELPDFEGPPEYDDVLNYLVSKHRQPGSGEEHIGHLMKVEAKHWNDEGKKRAILAQIRDSAGHTGLDQSFYDAKNNLLQDAQDCWTAHNRNKFCPDYKTPPKLLMPDTGAERKEVGAGKFRSTTYLCDFCPVKSMVQQAYFDKTGARD